VTSRRPETFDDLANWERTETLADFTLTPDGMKAGLLAAINGVVQAFTANSTREQPVTVECVDGCILITRPRPQVEIARRFEAAQERWDREHPPRDEVPAGWAEPRGVVDHAQLSPETVQVLTGGVPFEEMPVGPWPGLPTAEDTAAIPVDHDNQAATQ
jgi:hypothetical protein